MGLTHRVQRALVGGRGDQGTGGETRTVDVTKSFWAGLGRGGEGLWGGVWKHSARVTCHLALSLEGPSRSSSPPLCLMGHPHRRVIQRLPGGGVLL